jgi:hypothetical protein
VVKKLCCFTSSLLRFGQELQRGKIPQVPHLKDKNERSREGRHCDLLLSISIIEANYVNKPSLIILFINFAFLEMDLLLLPGICASISSKGNGLTNRRCVQLY